MGCGKSKHPSQGSIPVLRLNDDKNSFRIEAAPPEISDDTLIEESEEELLEELEINTNELAVPIVDHTGGIAQDEEDEGDEVTLNDDSEVGLRQINAIGNHTVNTDSTFPTIADEGGEGDQGAYDSVRSETEISQTVGPINPVEGGDKGSSSANESGTTSEGVSSSGVSSRTTSALSEYENITHKDDDKADKAAPVLDEAVNSADEAAPIATDAEPSGDETAASSDTAASSREATPSGDETAPSGDETAPSGDETAPSGDETAPSGDETAPSGDETAPSGDETQPSGGSKDSPSTETGSVTSSDYEKVTKLNTAPSGVEIGPSASEAQVSGGENHPPSDGDTSESGLTGYEKVGINDIDENESTTAVATPEPPPAGDAKSQSVDDTAPTLDTKLSEDDATGGELSDGSIAGSEEADGGPKPLESSQEYSAEEYEGEAPNRLEGSEKDGDQWVKSPIDDPNRATVLGKPGSVRKKSESPKPTSIFGESLTKTISKDNVGLDDTDKSETDLTSEGTEAGGSKLGESETMLASEGTEAEGSELGESETKLNSEGTEALGSELGEIESKTATNISTDEAEYGGLESQSTSTLNEYTSLGKFLGKSEDDSVSESLPPATAVTAPEPKAETPAPKAETPASQAESPASQAESPASQAESPASQAESPASQAESPASKSATPASKADTPAPKADTPAPKAETPAPKALTPASKAGSPAPISETPIPRVEVPAPKAATPLLASPLPSWDEQETLETVELLDEPIGKKHYPTTVRKETPFVETTKSSTDPTPQPAIGDPAMQRHSMERKESEIAEAIKRATEPTAADEATSSKPSERLELRLYTAHAKRNLACKPVTKPGGALCLMKVKDNHSATNYHLWTTEEMEERLTPSTQDIFNYLGIDKVPKLKEPKPDIFSYLEDQKRNAAKQEDNQHHKKS